MVKDDVNAHLDDKRSGFLPFLDLPRYTDQPLELALDLPPQDEQRFMLEGRGWSVVDAHKVAATLWDYQRYIQGSLGEFSCAKPACLKLENAWFSNRHCVIWPAVSQPLSNTQDRVDSSRIQPAYFGSAM